jgi:hypothetical protein
VTALAKELDRMVQVLCRDVNQDRVGFLGHLLQTLAGCVIRAVLANVPTLAHARRADDGARHRRVRPGR